MKLTALLLTSLTCVSYGQMSPQPMQEVVHDGEQCLLDWQGVAGRTYFIQYSLDLQTWSFMPVIESGTGAPLGYGFDTDAEKMFLRLNYTDDPTTSPNSDDFDNDGISNWDEVREGGTGTNPFLEDTNGDGVRDDGLVYAAQNDPDGAGLSVNIQNGLIGRWDFEGLDFNPPAGFVITDQTGNGNHATPASGAGLELTEAVISKSCKIPDAGYLSIPATVMNGVKEFNLSMWIKPTEGSLSGINNAKNRVIWSYGDTQTSLPLLFLSIQSETSIKLRRYNGATVEDVATWTAPDKLDDGQWRHISLARVPNGSTDTQYKLHINGVQIGAAWGGGNTSFGNNPNGYFLLGRLATGNSATQFDGLIDRLLLHNRGLSQAEALELYNNDVDGDGLFDWYEARYRKDRVIYADDPNEDDDRDELTNLQEQQLDTHPRNFDTDGDLLPDGFEDKYDLDPRSDASPNGKLGDPDGDGLVNIDEVIFQTDPKKVDTDGDGVSDNTESTQGSLPNDATDNGEAPDPAEIMQLRVACGDPSSSHSERYSLRIRDMKTYDIVIDHQARDFGVVSEKIYKQFRKGRSYSIELKWLDTNKPEDELPDFDYFSEVAFVNAADGQNYLLFDAVDFFTSMKAMPANGQKVLESSRDAQNNPVGTGDSGASDFLDTIALYRAFLFNTDVIVQNQILPEPPADGTVVLKTDKIRYHLSQHIVWATPILKDCISWHRRKLKWDGSFESWVAVPNATGHIYKENPTEAGIFEVKAVIDGQDYIFKRKEDDPHSGKKEGDHDCYGVVDEAWQIDLRDEAKSHLGSLAYATKEYKSLAFRWGTNKCNLFVAHRANEAGAPVQNINGGTVPPYYPPTANQWAGYEVKNIPNWTILPRQTYPQPGYIVSRYNTETSGHCAILDYDGAWISAGEKTVNRVADMRAQGYNDDDPNTPQGPARVHKHTP